MASAFPAVARGLKKAGVSLLALWLFGAARFDGPFLSGDANLALALVWLAAFIAAGWSRRPRLIRAALVLAVLIPWLLIRPSNERDWKPEFARTGWSEIAGDRVTLHEVRHFDYPADGEVVERWESRVVHLSNLRGVDFFLDAFMGEWIAHPIFSFDFGPEGRLTLSVETRRERHESFSMFGGLYKMFELQYLFGDERDFIRVRTNARREPVYLYRMGGTPANWRVFFLKSLKTQNRLKERPVFYNVVTANCTTSLSAQKPAALRGRSDIRLLLNGKLDELLYECGAFAVQDLPFAELRRRGFISDKAAAAPDATDFSERIRVGVPGF